MAPTSKNLYLAAIVALSVYVPFDTVAKVSLILAAFLFVVDPIPPYSRLIAIVSCWIVLKLNKHHRNFLLQQQHEEELASMEIVAVDDEAGSGKGKDNNEEPFESKKEL